MPTEWKDVFALAVKVAKEIREKNPKIGVADSTKKAYLDPRVKALRKKFDEDKKKKEKK